MYENVHPTYIEMSDLQNSKFFNTDSEMVLDFVIPYFSITCYEHELSISYTDHSTERSLTWHTVGQGFESRPDHTTDCKDGTYCFLAKWLEFKGYTKEIRSVYPFSS